MPDTLNLANQQVRKATGSKGYYCDFSNLVYFLSILNIYPYTYRYCPSLKPLLSAGDRDYNRNPKAEQNAKKDWICVFHSQ